MRERRGEEERAVVFWQEEVNMVGFLEEDIVVVG